MKNIIVILVVTLGTLLNTGALAQTPGRLPKIHERILQAKLREIKTGLRLDDASYQKFRPIYVRYDRELSGIELWKLARMMKVEPDSLSAEEAERVLTDQMQSTRKLLDIREKYIGQFSSVLTPQQIIKLFQTEAEIRKKVTNELKRRMIRQ